MCVYVCLSVCILLLLPSFYPASLDPPPPPSPQTPATPPPTSLKNPCSSFSTSLPFCLTPSTCPFLSPLGIPLMPPCITPLPLRPTYPPPTPWYTLSAPTPSITPLSSRPRIREHPPPVSNSQTATDTGGGTTTTTHTDQHLPQQMLQQQPGCAVRVLRVMVSQISSTASTHTSSASFSNTAKFITVVAAVFFK